MLEKLRTSIMNSVVIDRGGYPYFINPISDGIPSADPELLKDIASAFESAQHIDCDKILAPEAMGIPLAVAMSLDTGIPYTILRKRSYGIPGEIAVPKKTGYSESCIYVNDVSSDDTVCIVDDVISTGGTLKAILHALVDQIGCKVSCIYIVFEKSDAWKAIADDFGVKVVTLMKIRMENGRLICVE